MFTQLRKLVNTTATALLMVVLDHTMTRFDIDALYNVLYCAFFCYPIPYPTPMTRYVAMSYTHLYITNFLKQIGFL